MGDEASSSAESRIGIGDRLAGFSVSPGGVAVLTGSRELTPGPEPGPEPITNLRLTREDLEAMTDEYIDYEMRAYNIVYGPNSTRDYKKKRDCRSSRRL